MEVASEPSIRIGRGYLITALAAILGSLVVSCIIALAEVRFPTPIGDTAILRETVPFWFALPMGLAWVPSLVVWRTLGRVRDQSAMRTAGALWAFMLLFGPSALWTYGGLAGWMVPVAALTVAVLALLARLDARYIADRKVPTQRGRRVAFAVLLVVNILFTFGSGAVVHAVSVDARTRLPDGARCIGLEPSCLEGLGDELNLAVAWIPPTGSPYSTGVLVNPSASSADIYATEAWIDRSTYYRDITQVWSGGQYLFADIMPPQSTIEAGDGMQLGVWSFPSGASDEWAIAWTRDGTNYSITGDAPPTTGVPADEDLLDLYYQVRYTRPV